MTLRLKTFGAVYLERDGVPLAGAPAQRRRLALLAYLATSGDTPVTRDKLLALLWPERDAPRARHSLSQLLYALRQELPANGLIATADDLRVDSHIVESDVRDFSDALHAGADARAVALYGGPFLDGFFVDEASEFERWAQGERSKFAARCGEALERLATTAERVGDAFRATEWWGQRLALDPTNARALTRLMESLASLGDRAGALRHARVYETLMRDEMGDAPERAVLELAERLRSDTGQSPVGPVRAPSVADVPPAHAPPLDSGVPEERPRRYWAVGASALAAAVVIALAVSVVGGGEDASSTPAKSVTVLVGDLSGPDTVLAMAVREALRAELSAAPSVTQISDLRARQIQGLMGQTPTARNEQAVLFEVALRSGAQVVVTGSATPLGSGAQLLVQLIDPSAGEVLRTLSARAAGVDEVVPAVASIGRALRAAIVEVPLDTTIHALPAVSTSSLAALKSYALARSAAAAGYRPEAVQHAERAVLHDSMFALAHYLAGDLLWFLDRQSHAEAHLSRAYTLSNRLELRERLAARARYEQIVNDRPDSALTYWDLLRDAAPRDPLAYEGRSWTLRSLGRYEEAATAADSAMQLDSSAVLPNASNALYSLLSVGDTTGAIALAARIGNRWPAGIIEVGFHAALVRGDIDAAMRLARPVQATPYGVAWLHQAALVGGDLPQARALLEVVRQQHQMAHFPRALLLQGTMELATSGDRRTATGYAREALQWVREQDLSPPAVARLAERIGDLAARAHDVVAVDATLDLVRKRDGGRKLLSYVLAERTLVAERAFARGDMASAARLAKAARYGVYFSRSLNTIVRLEADARRAAGEVDAARALDQMIEAHEIADGDFWTWVFVRAMTLRTPASQLSARQ